MTSDVAECALIADIFDRHASLHIDDMSYRTNDILHDAADRIFALAGLTGSDVSNDGLTLYRTYAVIEAFENTVDGKPIFRDGSRVRRVVTVNIGEHDRIEITMAGDPEPVYLNTPRIAS